MVSSKPRSIRSPEVDGMQAQAMSLNLEESPEALESIITQDLLAGTLTEYVASHPGRSQYSRHGGGVSACGLAALNCARVILGQERAGLRNNDLLQMMMRRSTVEDILRLCLSWSSSAHLDVEEIYKSPVFERSLKKVSSDYGRVGKKHFKSMLQRLKEVAQRSGCASCAVITRPPEIISCFYIVAFDVEVFVIFDSHPRPDLHPEGAAFIFKTSFDDTAAYLAELLPFDERLIAGNNVQWEAQLLANFSSHVFVARESAGSISDWTDTALQASLETLSLRAEQSELKSQNATLTAENARLHDKVARLTNSLQDLHRKSQQKKPRAQAEQRSSMWGIPSLFQLQTSTSRQGSSSWPALNPNAVTTRASPPRASSTSPRTNSPPDRRNESHTRSGSASSGSFIPEHHDLGAVHDPKQEDADLAIAAQLQAQIELAERRDYEFALQQQQQFDWENVRLLTERESLVQTTVGSFSCGICMDVFSEEDVAQVDSCHHRLCRSCALSYVSVQLDQRRFPIVCPICSAGKLHNPSMFDIMFLQQLGLSEKQSEILTELQLAAFSIPLHCRSCQQSFFVDKEEYRTAEVIGCPLPTCRSTWCRACSRQIDAAGPAHSCDGSSELKHLMGEKGWKYCPGCKTPTERISGCNHMKCTSPGCNTHFCYLCGHSIIQSINLREIDTAMRQHYSSCKLFEY